MVWGDGFRSDAVIQGLLVDESRDTGAGGGICIVSQDVMPDSRMAGMMDRQPSAMLVVSSNRP